MGKTAAAKRPAKPTKPLTETEPANDLEANLVELLKALDNLGVSMVESQWREMTEAENNSVVEWASRRRIGTKSPLPLCLRGYASAELLTEQDQYLAAQEEGRTIRIPVTKFCKHGWEVTEEGDETVQMKIKVPDSHCRGDSALEFFGRKRCRIRFSRRQLGEWNQGELPIDSSTQIFECESEIPSFGWSNGDFHFAFWTDSITDSQAKRLYRKAGSIELQVLGEAVKGDDSEAVAAPKRKPGRPKKEPAAPKADEPTLPGMTDGELTESHSVSLTENYRVDIGIAGLPEGKFSCAWSGNGPAGACEQGEPSIRTSINEAAKASIGHAIDRWSANPDDESKLVVANLRDWLGALEAGKSPKLIEAEFADDDPEGDGDDDTDE